MIDGNLAMPFEMMVLGVLVIVERLDLKPCDCCPVVNLGLYAVSKLRPGKMQRAQQFPAGHDCCSTMH
jgi:hypothetical protein